MLSLLLIPDEILYKHWLQHRHLPIVAQELLPNNFPPRRKQILKLGQLLHVSHAHHFLHLKLPCHLLPHRHSLLQVALRPLHHLQLIPFDPRQLPITLHPPVSPNVAQTQRCPIYHLNLLFLQIAPVRRIQLLPRLIFWCGLSQVPQSPRDLLLLLLLCLSHNNFQFQQAGSCNNFRSLSLLKPPSLLA